MKIILGITGSIAAYKAADLASQLVKLGHQINLDGKMRTTDFTDYTDD